MTKQANTDRPEFEQALRIDDLDLADVEVAVEDDAYALPEAGATMSPRFSCSVVWQ